jgi:hypothetical protein
VSVTIPPRVRYHMVVSSTEPHAALRLFRGFFRDIRWQWPRLARGRIIASSSHTEAELPLCRARPWALCHSLSLVLYNFG